MPNDLILLAGRLLVAFLFVVAGVGTLGDVSASAAYFGALGLPFSMPVAVATGLFEIGAGLAVLAGYQTRIAAALLAGFCIAAGFIGHYGQGGESAMLSLMHSQMLMKDIAIAGGLLVLMVQGPGAYSLDARRSG